jgi:hypothetical protein
MGVYFMTFFRILTGTLGNSLGFSKSALIMYCLNGSLARNGIKLTPTKILF